MEELNLNIDKVTPKFILLTIAALFTYKQYDFGAVYRHQRLKESEEQKSLSTLYVCESVCACVCVCIQTYMQIQNKNFCHH